MGNNISEFEYEKFMHFLKSKDDFKNEIAISIALSSLIIHQELDKINKTLNSISESLSELKTTHMD